MKNAAIERAQGMGKGDNYKDMYPATRADNVSREELKETFQRYFQESYDILMGLMRSLDGKQSDELADWIEDDWTRYHNECNIIRKLFGLRTSVDDSGRVTVTGICE